LPGLLREKEGEMRRYSAFLIVAVFLLASACGGQPTATPTPTSTPTTAPTIETTPLGSGQWIAFWSERDGNPEIYKMRADGSQLTRLTNNPALDVGVAWGP